MKLDLSTVAMLTSTPALRTVFKHVVEKRKADFREIYAQVSKEAQREEVVAFLQQLKNEELIAVASAPLVDFNVYYVTAKGLGVEREMRKMVNGF